MYVLSYKQCVCVWRAGGPHLLLEHQAGCCCVLLRVDAYACMCVYVPACMPVIVLCTTGPLPIDQEVYSQLLATGQFEQMSLDVDEVRHSIHTYTHAHTHVCVCCNICDSKI